MSDDSWKGLDKTRIKPSPEAENESRRLKLALWHHNRRKAGIPHPGKRENDAFRARIFYPWGKEP